MTLIGLAARNLGRDRARAALTVLSVAVVLVAFLLLRAVSWAWEAGPKSAPRDRLVTRNKITFSMTLPRHYVDRVRKVAHVRAATWANWFGGRDPRHETDFFATIAVDPSTYFEVYDEMRVSPDVLRAFQHDKQGAIVGDALARRLGWHVGDRVALQSGIIPGDWQFTIDGTYTAASQSVDKASFLFRWDYVNDAIPIAYRDQIGWIASRIDTGHTADVGAQIDGMFEDRDAQTLSQDERSVNASFLAMFSALLEAMNAVSAVILVIMSLILANTIAMGVRGRMGEYAVLRAIGFGSAQVALSILAESLWLGAAGAAVGTAVAWPLVNITARRLVEDHLGPLLPYFRLELRHVALGVAASLVGAAAAAVVPAWSACRRSFAGAVNRLP